MNRYQEGAESMEQETLQTESFLATFIQSFARGEPAMFAIAFTLAIAIAITDVYKRQCPSCLGELRFNGSSE